MEKQTWINEILASTDDIAKVVPDAVLFLKIQRKINEEETVNPQWIWIAAASLILLASLNVKLLCSKSNNAKSATEKIAASITNSNQFY